MCFYQRLCYHPLQWVFNQGVKCYLMPTLVPVCVEDEPFLLQLYASTRQAELDAWGLDEATRQQFLQMQWQAQKHSYARQYPDATHHLICSQQCPAGRLLVAREEQTITLVDIALLPAYQNQGLGTALLRTLQEEAATRGQSIQLHVLQHNPARRLYERLGFTCVDSNGLHDRMEWQMPSNIPSRGETDE